MILFLVDVIWLLASFALRTPGPKRLHHTMTRIYREAKAGTLERQLPLDRIVNIGGTVLTVAYLATILRGI